jgi:uncharacterized protein
VRKFKLNGKTRLALVAVALVAIVAIAVLTSGDQQPKPVAQNSACGPYRTDKIVTINGQTFNTEIASSDAAKGKGLSGRPCILPNQAMLFPFSKDGHYSFWMQDMKFPIDVVWITSGHKIAAIEGDFQPSSYPERRGNKLPAQYVLEVKANRMQQLGASIGTPVTL